MTKEEIITLITTKFIHAEEQASNWFQMYEEAERNKSENIRTYESLFYQWTSKKEVLHDLLKEITK